MTREIKFRGRYVTEASAFYPAVDKWVYGFYFKQDGTCWIREKQTGNSFRVLSKTVGQYIDLKDKNDVEIFEGDITGILSESGKWNHHIVKYGIVRREMATGWIVDIPSFYFDLIRGDFKAFPIVKNYKGKHDLEQMVILGNISENPELWED